MAPGQNISHTNDHLMAGNGRHLDASSNINNHFVVSTDSLDYYSLGHLWALAEASIHQTFAIVSAAQHYYYICTISSRKVGLCSEDGTADSRQWFFDGNLIRSKAYPNKMISLCENNIDLCLEEYTQNNKKIQWSLNKHGFASAYDSSRFAVIDNRLTTASLMYHISQAWYLTSGQKTKLAMRNAKTTGFTTFQSSYFWTWDGEYLRSETDPAYFITAVTSGNNIFTFTSEIGQQWHISVDGIIRPSHNTSLALAEDWFVKALNYDPGQMWGLQSNSDTVYFAMLNNQTGKVICIRESPSLGFCDIDKEDFKQQWFTIGDFVYSRFDSALVLDLHADTYNSDGKGRVYLHAIHGRDNQKWVFEGEHIVSKHKNAYIDGHWSQPYGYKLDGSSTQRWTVFEPRLIVTPESCGDKLEEDINKVVQWIPLVSTIWDLSASIAYGIKGCQSMAKERATSFGIGLALDIATAGALKGGSLLMKSISATGIQSTSVVMKQTLKSGLQQVGKVSTKATVAKTAVSTILMRTGKFVFKATVVENYLALKSLIKLGTKTVTLTPSKIYKGLKASVGKLKELKNLKKVRVWKTGGDDLGEALIKNGNDVGGTATKKARRHIRCRRSSNNCILHLIDLAEEIKVLKNDLMNPSYLSDQILDTARSQMKQRHPIAKALNRYHKILKEIAKQGEQAAPKALKDEAGNLWNTLRYNYDVDEAMIKSWSDAMKRGEVDNVIDEIAIFTYTDVLNYNHHLRDPITLFQKHLKGFSDALKENTVLMQNYVLKHPSGQPRTLYRRVDMYDDLKKLKSGQTLQLNEFTSTTVVTDAPNFRKAKYRHLFEIRNAKSGADISPISNIKVSNKLFLMGQIL